MGRSLISSVKKEFRLKNIFFTHKKTHMFIKSQLQDRRVYLVWLVIAALGHMGVLTTDVIMDFRRNNNVLSTRWLLPLSNWAYLMLVIMILWDLAVVIYANANAMYLFGTEFGGKAPMPWYLKVNWALHVLGTDTSLAVAVIYWIWIDPTYYLDDYFFNIANAIFTSIHLIIGRKPSRIYHLYLPAAFFSIYIGFTKIYQSLTDEVVYSAIDWSKVPEVYKLALPLALCAGPVAHVINYALHQIRALCCWPKNRDLDELDSETLARKNSKDSVHKTHNRLDRVQGGRQNAVVPMTTLGHTH